jgi:NADPH:quinone reductase-like Zn-dependent oxidoreductase
MRAVVQDRYGPPEILRLADVAPPVPADDEVLVRVHATTVNRTDCAFRSATPFVSRFFTGLRRPKWRVSGGELAGEVEEIGAAVTEFAVGDHVFGVNAGRFGAHAELVAVRERAPLAHKPPSLSFDEAAAVCDGAILALGCLRRAGVGPGRRVLVYGASGSIGTAGVQLARHFGAHVTAVCGTPNIELVRSLGADEVIDYMQEDFAKNGETYDVIVDAVGRHSFRRCKGSLRPGGVYVATEGWRHLFLTLWTRRFGTRRVVMDIPPAYTKQNVLFLKELIEAGEYRAVIDRRYRLEEVVEASSYVETGQKVGNVVLTVVAEGS